ncbi:MAG: efflux RND transporter periplasmic adaptor subunit [Polyangiaceae bacterium]|jgi:cobalt-zinc-cadmium efflux system membrane fusion protein
MTCITKHLSNLLLVVAAASAVSCHPSQAAQAASESAAGELWLTPAQVAEAKIEVAAAGEQVVDDTILTSGTITLDDLRSGHVFSPVTGRVTRIFAQLGQRVKKGDPLATIESPDIGNAVSDVHKGEADLIAAEHDLRRKKALYAQKAASAADVEASEDADRNAKAEVERARQKEFLLRVGNVDTVTQTYTLPAPIDGEVLLRNINPGVEVQGQYSGGAGNNCLPGLTTNAVCGELFTIGELDKVWALGDVYEIDLGRVHVGAPAKVTTVAYPGQVFTGVVDWVSGSLDANTRTAKVRCTFDNPDGKLRPMMYASVQISVDARKALAIPRSAVVRLGDYKVVFAEVGQADGRVHFERLPIAVDESTLTPYVAVKHGVEAGQRIVVSGASNLSQRL